MSRLNSLLHLSSFQITALVVEEHCVTLSIASRRMTACCPCCGHRSRWRHSRYHRVLADLPCSGMPVQLTIAARRFFCRNQCCARRVFCERLPTLVRPYARRTDRLLQLLTEVGFALGGEPGARLAVQLGMTASPASLLHLIRQAPASEVVSPTVVGVDDWALRTGHSYGTILVDLERHCLVDVVPDRTANAFSDWLAQHLRDRDHQPGSRRRIRRRREAGSTGCSARC